MALRQTNRSATLGKAERPYAVNIVVSDGASIVDLAAQEKVHKSYLCRLLRLTVLSPSVIEAILSSKLPGNVLLADMIASSIGRSRSVNSPFSSARSKPSLA